MKKTRKSIKGRGMLITPKGKREGEEEKHTFFLKKKIFFKSEKNAWVASEEALV